MILSIGLGQIHLSTRSTQYSRITESNNTAMRWFNLRGFDAVNQRRKGDNVNNVDGESKITVKPMEMQEARRKISIVTGRG